MLIEFCVTVVASCFFASQAAQNSDWKKKDCAKDPEPCHDILGLANLKKGEVFTFLSEKYTVVSYSDENFSFELPACFFPSTKKEGQQRVDGCKIDHSHLNEKLSFE